MKRGARITPEALAAQGIVQGPDGHWRKAPPGNQSLATQAPDDTLWRCTKCGQVGTVGRCCGLSTREPLNDAARAEMARLTKGRGQWAPYRNKTENRFAYHLSQQSWHRDGSGILYEKMKLAVGTVGGRTAWYCPDFVAMLADRTVKVYEVKGGGPWRRHGIERLRCAALAWPMWEWYLVEWVKGEWLIKRVEG